MLFHRFLLQRRSGQFLQIDVIADCTESACLQVFKKVQAAGGTFEDVPHVDVLPISEAVETELASQAEIDALLEDFETFSRQHEQAKHAQLN